MLFLFAAMYTEASVFISNLDLKKDITQTKFQSFISKDSDIVLTITGAGPISAAVAVSVVLTAYKAGRSDCLINLGSAGALNSPKSSSKNAKESPENNTGEGFYICNKITEQSTGRCFYPDMIYKSDFEEASVISCIAPISEGMAVKTLYDMESSSIYQACSHFLPPHHMIFLKIISDSGEAVTGSDITSLMARNAAPVCDFILGLKNALVEEKKAGEIFTNQENGFIKKLFDDLFCSQTMKNQLIQLLTYKKLSGSDFVSELNKEYYDKEILPVSSKVHGKKVLEELQKKTI